MKRKVLSTVLLIVVALVLSASAAAQNQGAPADGARHDPARSVVRIVADVDSAIVLIDSLPAGVTPLLLATLTPGRHRVTLLHPDVSNWLTAGIADTILVEPGKEQTFRYAFPKRYLIVSIPSGADVLQGDSLLGTTPLLTRFQGGGDPQELLVQKKGHRAAKLSLGSNSRGVVSVRLEKEWNSGEENDVPFRNQTEASSHSLRLYISGIATIIAGTAAAYFKVEADQRYEDYLNSGDPVLRDQTRRLDTASAVALVATQIGLGLFTYFVLSE